MSLYVPQLSKPTPQALSEPVYPALHLWYTTTECIVAETMCFAAFHIYKGSFFLG